MKKLHVHVTAATLIHAVICFYFHVSAECNMELISDEDRAHEWLTEYNRAASEVYSRNHFLWWDYKTNMTDYNLAKAYDDDKVRADFERDSIVNASCFDRKEFTNPAIKREFSKILATKQLEESERKELSELETHLTEIYSNGKVCARPSDSDPSKCYDLQPGLTDIFGESTDWNDLLWAWKGWRDATGKLMREEYAAHVPLLNKRARISGFCDAGDLWKDSYENENFEEEIKSLFDELTPLYKPLHAYVRQKLQLLYADNEFPETGHIPAHILGDMWASYWTHLINENSIVPYPGRAISVDTTQAMREKNFTVTQMYQVAETFFKSLGFGPLPQSFWDDSLLEKPEDGRVDCHGNAWDFLSGKDFRILYCTDINHKDFLVVHHEMGHIYYFMQYKDQPITFKDGASPAVHEAIGDLILLSATTPSYLHSIGLINSASSQYEDTINYLMLKAFEITAFLPFGYLVDQWRWDVFSGKITAENYNKAWWDLRCRIQGVSPPIARSEKDFDPGAKYHVAADSPYIRYFLSSILMFQYQKALCIEANYTGPPHECNLYGSTKAGEKLREMLSLGYSIKFPESLMLIANTRKISAEPLVEYFQPLIQWLEKENKNLKTGWTDECPEGSFFSSSVQFTFSFFLLSLVLMSQII